MRSTPLIVSTGLWLAVSLLIVGGCAPTGSSGGSDCREASDACAEGFMCVEVEGDWTCQPACDTDEDCGDEELCHEERGACVSASDCRAICVHVRDGRVGYAECSYGDVVYDPNIDQIDNNDIDPRDDRDPRRAYFATKSDYSYQTVCDE